jgi:hypothetical protein
LWLARVGFSCTASCDIAIIQFLDSERMEGGIGDLDMSIHQTTVEAPSIYRVVGRRPTGERVEISQTADLAAAERVMSLMWTTATYSDIFIECNGKRLSPD